MKLLVIDTETTGLSPRFNQLLTVGLLPIEVGKNSLEILGEEHLFIKHERYNTSAVAMGVNKINLITHGMKGMQPWQACKKIGKFVDKYDLLTTPLLGHNLGFDRGFLNELFEKEAEENPLSEESHDTMHTWRMLKKQGKIPSELRSTLGTLAEYFNINYTKAHDALADCHITAKVYHKMLGI